MTKFLAIFSLVIIVLLAFAACGEESTPTPAPAAQAIDRYFPDGIQCIHDRNTPW